MTTKTTTTASASHHQAPESAEEKAVPQAPAAKAGAAKDVDPTVRIPLTHKAMVH